MTGPCRELQERIALDGARGLRDDAVAQEHLQKRELRRRQDKLALAAPRGLVRQHRDSPAKNLELPLLTQRATTTAVGSRAFDEW